MIDGLKTVSCARVADAGREVGASARLLATAARSLAVRCALELSSDAVQNAPRAPTAECREERVLVRACRTETCTVVETLNSASEMFLTTGTQGFLPLL